MVSRESCLLAWLQDELELTELPAPIKTLHLIFLDYVDKHWRFRTAKGPQITLKDFPRGHSRAAEYEILTEKNSSERGREGERKTVRKKREKRERWKKKERDIIDR